MKTISVINMKGGVAKTTLAINLADCLTKRLEKKVLLIDVDPQFNATQCVFSPEEYVEYLKKEKDTILNIFDRRTRPMARTVEGPSVQQPAPLKEIEPAKISRNLYVIPGNLELYRLEMAPGEGREHRLERYIDSLEQEGKFDFVIIDTPPTPSVWMTSALIASDHYLIPVKPDPISITGIDLLHNIVSDKRENFNLKISCIGLVFTIVEEATKVYREAREYVENDPNWRNHVYRGFLAKRTEVARKQGEQQFILDCDDAAIKRAIVAITNEMISRVERNE